MSVYISLLLTVYFFLSISIGNIHVEQANAIQSLLISHRELVVTNKVFTSEISLGFSTR